MSLSLAIYMGAGVGVRKGLVETCPAKDCARAVAASGGARATRPSQASGCGAPAGSGTGATGTGSSASARSPSDSCWHIAATGSSAVLGCNDASAIFTNHARCSVAIF